MAKNRYIDTIFWKDTYISNLDPSEKLLFLYFLTNPYTNIIGIYEISLREIAFDTGFDKDMILRILERFKKDWKIIYLNWYICIVNFLKHQKLNPKTKLWAEKILNEIKPSFWLEFQENDRLYIDYIKALNYFNLNLNINSNLNSNWNSNLDENFSDENFSEENSREKNLKKFWEYENVKLTEQEVERLKNDFGLDIFEKYLKILDEWIEMKGYKYKNHNLAFRKWLEKDNIWKIWEKQKVKTNLVDLL